MRAGTSSDSDAVVVRPRKVRTIAIPTAIFLVVVFAIVGALLRGSETGAHFRVSDQVAMGLLGVLLAAGVLLTLRPRLWADTAGVEVRNIISTHRYDWSYVRTFSFPDGAPWARLELPDNEYVPVIAIQAYDGGLAVQAMRQLRELRRKVDSHNAGSDATNADSTSSGTTHADSAKGDATNVDDANGDGAR